MFVVIGCAALDSLAEGGTEREALPRTTAFFVRLEYPPARSSDVTQFSFALQPHGSHCFRATSSPAHRFRGFCAVAHLCRAHAAGIQHKLHLLCSSVVAHHVNEVDAGIRQLRRSVLGSLVDSYGDGEVEVLCVGEVSWRFANTCNPIAQHGMVQAYTGDSGVMELLDKDVARFDLLFGLEQGTELDRLRLLVDPVLPLRPPQEGFFGWLPFFRPLAIPGA